MKTIAKKITVSLKEKSATEDKRVIAKLKQQFEMELTTFKSTTQVCVQLLLITQ